MSKKVCIFEYSEEEWQEYCQKHNLGGWINRDWLRSAKVAEEVK